MGTYTEIYVRCRIREDVDSAVIEALKSMTGQDGALEFNPVSVGLDPDIFGPEDRGSCMLDFVTRIQGPKSFFQQDGSGNWHLEARSEIKNYNGEIEKFFTWIRPHLVEDFGVFIGFSLHEEFRSEPKLFFA